MVSSFIKAIESCAVAAGVTMQHMPGISAWVRLTTDCMIAFAAMVNFSVDQDCHS
jgi:hypothetical protein